MTEVDYPCQMRVINESGYPFQLSTDGSIGYDLHAVLGTARDVEPGRRWSFDTGISIELPAGLGALVQPRSGLSKHHGILATTGVIDRDYRGRIGVILINTGNEVYRVLPGDRIAQLVLVRVPSIQIVEVDNLTDTERGASGFGSTGR